VPEHIADSRPDTEHRDVPTCPWCGEEDHEHELGLMHDDDTCAHVCPSCDGIYDITAHITITYTTAHPRERVERMLVSCQLDLDHTRHLHATATEPDIADMYAAHIRYYEGKLAQAQTAKADLIRTGEWMLPVFDAACPVPECGAAMTADAEELTPGVEWRCLQGHDGVQP
jgi:hypothetical protein